MSSYAHLFLHNIRMKIKEIYKISLSENVLDILLTEMLEKGEPITYESIVEQLTK